MKKTTILILSIVMVILAITATGCTRTSARETGTIENVYSETREALKEKCQTLVGENEQGTIVVNFASGKPVEIYYNGYSVEGPYNFMFYDAMVLEPENQFTQEEAIRVLNRLEFFVEDSKIIYRDTVSEEFQAEKAGVTSIESGFKDAFKNELKEFVEAETGAEILNHYIKVYQNDNSGEYTIRYGIQAKGSYGVEYEMEYHVYFFGNYNELEKVATALMEGKDIRLPDYEYELTNHYYIEVTVK